MSTLGREISSLAPPAATPESTQFLNLENQLFDTLEVIVMGKHVVTANDRVKGDQNVRRLTIHAWSPDIIRPANYLPQPVISINMKRFQIIKVIRINKIKLWIRIQSLRKYKYAFILI